MADELLFRVEGAKATPTERISLADAGLKERSDLQEWVIASSAPDDARASRASSHCSDSRRSPS